MTLLEKIKNYKWFDSPNKLRVILEEMYNSIGVRTAVLTGFTSGAGTVSATDNVLQAIQKLDGNNGLKANSVHTHVISDVTGLQGALDGKAPTVHNHAISEVTNLQTTLNSKEDVLNKVTSILNNETSTTKYPNVKAVVDWVTTNVQGAPFGGSIIPTSTPSGTGATFWFATESGTYTNFGGVVVAANSLAVISRSADGTFSISQTALDLTNYLQKTDNIKIKTWTAQSYLSGSQVNHLGKDWTSNAATVAGDIPSVSEKWIERLSGYGSSLFDKDTVGNSLFGTGTTQSSSVNKVVINQSLTAKLNSKLSYVKIKSNASGTGSFNLIHLRRNKNLAKYTVVNTIPLNYDTIFGNQNTRSIDLSSLNIDVIKDDAFGIQNVSGTALVMSIVSSLGSEYGMLVVNPVNGVIEIAENLILTKTENIGFNAQFDVVLSQDKVKNNTDNLTLVNASITSLNSQVVVLNDQVADVPSIKSAVLSEADMVVSVIDKKNDTGWVLNTFNSWSAGYIPTENMTLSNVMWSLSNVNENEKLQLNIYTRPVVNIDSAAVGGSLIGDVLIQTKDFAISLFQNVATLQDVYLPFTKISATPNYIYIFQVKALKTGNTVGVLGSDRSATNGAVTKQYERGWYNNFNAVPSTYWIVRTIFKAVNVNNVTVLSDRVTALESKQLISGTSLFSDMLTAISNDWINANGWSVVTGGIAPTATGLDKFILLNKQYSLGNRKARVRVNFGATSRFLLFTKPQEGNNSGSTIVECDVSANLIKIYANYDNGVSLPAVVAQKTYVFTAGRDYIVELEKDNFNNIIKVTDTVSGVTDSLTDTTRTTGRQHDNYCMAVFSGSLVTVKSFDVLTSIKKGCKALVLGDSITEGWYSPLAVGEGYAFKLMTALNNNGGVSGRGGGSILGTLRLIETEVAFIKPIYVVVTIGTNGSVTSANLTQLCNRIIELGSIPIINNVPREGNADDLATNPIIEQVRGNLNVKGCLFNIATSNGYVVSNGINQSLYNSDGGIYVHPNVSGMQKMFERFAIDVPYLLD